MGLGLHQEGADGVPLLFWVALHQSHIAPPGDDLVPLGLEQLFGLCVLGEHQHAGGIPVQPVKNKDAVIDVLAFHIVSDDVVGGAGLFFFIGHG